MISTRCKLDSKMGYMVIRGEERKRIFLDEIAVLMIENPAVAMTGCLLQVLAEKKVRIIFCNQKHIPYGELAPYYGSFDCAEKIKAQIAWSNAAKGTVWRRIVGQKILQQLRHMEEYGCVPEVELLQSYLQDIQPDDSTNREGLAAKVYFSAIFGTEFRRGDSDPINAALDYGYGIILAAFNREISSCGYLTQLGIHHDNCRNYYNLSSDLMEPYRILIDRAVRIALPKEFSKDVRYQLVNILNETILIEGSEQTVLNSIKIYLRTVFAALETNTPSCISFYSL